MHGQMYSKGVQSTAVNSFGSGFTFVDGTDLDRCAKCVNNFSERSHCHIGFSIQELGYERRRLIQQTGKVGRSKSFRSSRSEIIWAVSAISPSIA